MAQQTGYPGGEAYPFGTPATKADIDAWNKDVRPDGMGLPAGQRHLSKWARRFMASNAPPAMARNWKASAIPTCRKAAARR